MRRFDWMRYGRLFRLLVGGKVDLQGVDVKTWRRLGWVGMIGIVVFSVALFVWLALGGGPGG